MIYCVNLFTYQEEYEGKFVYCGRTCNGYKDIGLGNPYTLRQYKREECIRLFRQDVLFVTGNNPKYKSLHPSLSLLKRSLDNLQMVYTKEKNLILGCWCDPSPCHTHVIKEYLETKG